MSNSNTEAPEFTLDIFGKILDVANKHYKEQNYREALKGLLMCVKYSSILDQDEEEFNKTIQPLIDICKQKLKSKK